MPRDLAAVNPTPSERRPSPPGRRSRGPFVGRWRAAAVTALVLGGSVLVGCGDGGDAGSTEPSTPQTGSSSRRGTSTSTSGGSGSNPGSASATTADATPGGGTPRVEALAAVSVKEPTMLLPRPGDDDHLYVAERAGRIRRLVVRDGGRTLARDGDALLDLTDQTTVESERGLLGLAFSADGATVYVSYTDLDGNTRLVSYAIGPDGAIDATSAEVLLAQDQPFSNHNGGHVVLGPDGKLWFGFGDGGAGDDPENRAQDPGTVLGKIVRFEPGDDPEIVVSGLRNPWRYSFDTDGSLWIGDVGQNQWEEIDHLAANEIEDANMGWSGYEGTHEHLDGDGRRPADAVPPVFDYSHDGGNCSVTGGFVYRGKAIADLQGAYLFADYCAGDVRAVTLDDQGRFDREIDLGIHIDGVVSFAADQDGEPYVLSQGGTISRLVPAS